MVDATPARCLPPDPSVSGAHYLQGRLGKPRIWRWEVSDATFLGWWISDAAKMSASVADGFGWSYVRPVPTVAELESADRTQRETDDALAEALATVEDLRERVKELTHALDGTGDDPLYDGRV